MLVRGTVTDVAAMFRAQRGFKGFGFAVGVENGGSYTSDGTVSRCGTVNVSYQREPINPAWSEIILGNPLRSLSFFGIFLSRLFTYKRNPRGRDGFSSGTKG